MNGQTGFDLHWATPEDEPEIRALVGSVAMPGAVSVRFAREPDYFLGASIMGDACDVLVARHLPDGRLAGIACRAERRAYVNGRETQLGYIGQIRVAPRFRGNWLVHRGAQWFKEASAPELLHFGVIARENPRARQLLTGGRLPGGLHIRRVCGLTTYAIVLREQRHPRTPGVHAQPASPEQLAEVVEFLRRHGSRRQFFPAYTLPDFNGGLRMRGLAPADIMVARREGAVAGVMAAWDQAAYKQDVVESYGPALRRLRPAYDLGARLFGVPRLTRPGQTIPLAFAACVCVVNDDLVVMRALLAACARSARARGKAFLMLGLADSDPLLAAGRGTLHVTYHSDLYAAAWSSEPLSQLDGRIPYIEIAAL
ncbi:MAG: hypothetical protein V1755_08245 [Chloroflexota bacterium]